VTPTPTPTPTPTVTPTPTPTPSPSSSSGGTLTDSSGQVLGDDPTLESGQTVTVDGTGFEPGEAVTVTLHSTTVVLGTVTAGADGSVSYVLTVPASLEAGAHTVVLAGSTTSVAVAFQVADTADTADPSDELPHTGAGSTGTLGLFALSAIVAGAGALIIARRIR
jgi:LPXTG-motif cell wall-anchored protein